MRDGRGHTDDRGAGYVLSRPDPKREVFGREIEAGDGLEELIAVRPSRLRTNDLAGRARNVGDSGYSLPGLNTL